MAATIELAPEPKQALLDERSEEARLRVVGELFGLALGRLEKAEEAQEAARSNGKVRFYLGPPAAVSRRIARVAPRLGGQGGALVPHGSAFIADLVPLRR